MNNHSDVKIILNKSNKKIQTYFEEAVKIKNVFERDIIRREI